jgi:hypothetical protein
MQFLIEIAELEDQHGGQWGEHPSYPLSDWKYAVANDGTRLGYWEWVWNNLEETEE